MSRIRAYIENYTLYRKLTDSEWSALRGRFSNRQLYELPKKELEEWI